MRRGANIACRQLKNARDLLLRRRREVAHYCSKDAAAAASSIFISADKHPKIGMRFFSSRMTTFKDLRTVKDNSFPLWEQYGKQCMLRHSVRTIASDSSQSSGPKSQEGTRKDISTVDDPFDAPTYHIPEKPVTFTEGASYSVIILAGLGVAGLAAYAVFKELIFEPKEYKIFGKALERVQRDSQVSVRIGSPVTGYGSESRNRAARQRIPNRVWTDEDGIEHVEVNFYIRGPHGAGKVYTEMFKDSSDKKWKFTYLIVEIKSPSPVKLLLESYVPA